MTVENVLNSFINGQEATNRNSLSTDGQTLTGYGHAKYAEHVKGGKVKVYLKEFYGYSVTTSRHLNRLVYLLGDRVIKA